MLRRILLPFIVLVFLAPSVTSDTYPEWKARVFSTQEQGDPAVSGENASPAGDGLPNLLKYALGLDPHSASADNLPVVTIQSGIYGGGLGDSFLTLSWRVSSENAPIDLYYVPEVTTDPTGNFWSRGHAFIVGPALAFADVPGAPLVYTAQAALPVALNPSTFMRLRILEGETLPDDWQIANFGQTGINPAGDADGDGISNFQEFLRGTGANDYYNGMVPQIEIVAGNHQISEPLSFLPSPLVIRLTIGGAPLSNAPVQFRVASGGGLFGFSAADTELKATLNMRTDVDGRAAPYFQLPSQHWAALPIAVVAGTASGTMTAHSNGGHLSGLPTVSVVSGNNQEAVPDRFLPSSLVVRFLGGNGLPIAGASITFSLVSGGGGFVQDRFANTISPSVTLLTNQEGLAWISYRTGATAGDFSQIVAAADGESSPATFVARTVSYAPAAAQSIATGAEHTIALYSDGTAWSWGANSRGQLGDGSNTDRWHREQVTGLSNVAAVSSHEQTSSALRTDGTVWTWGSNAGYGLGNGESSDSTVPVQVMEGPGMPLTNVIAIASGYSHHLALKSDGTVCAWGSDWAFQLGNTSENDSAYALPVLQANGSPLQGVAAVACGDDHNLALKADGTIWSWGYNGDSELGTGNRDWRSAAPQVVVNLTNIVAIAGGSAHSLALKADGAVWSWGRDSHGCIGDGTVGGTRAVPVLVHNLDHVVGIAAAASHSLALRSDGTVWAWGANSDGQLGLSASSSGNYAQKSAANASLNNALPRQTAGLASVVGIAAGGNDSFAVTASAELIGWGANSGGELGNRPQTDPGTTPLSVADFRLSEDPDHDGLGTWKELALGGNPDAYSTAGDTISDGWKAFYSLALFDPNLATRDATGKGLTTLQDFLLGTDPTKLSTVNDGIADGWKVNHGFDPLNASLAGQDLTGRGMTVAAYYQSQTSASNISTVEDGIPDWWKIQHNLDIHDRSVANADGDADGLTNLEEFLAGTDPGSRDSDGDTVPDGTDGWPNEYSLSPPRAGPVRYAIIDLGVDRTAEDLNSAGKVIGNVRKTHQAFVWSQGSVQEIQNTTVVRINDAGQILTSQSLIQPNGSVTPLNGDGVVLSIFDMLTACDLDRNGTVAANWVRDFTTFKVHDPLRGPPNQLGFIYQRFSLPGMPPCVLRAIASDGSLAGDSQRAATGFPQISLAPAKAIVDRGAGIVEIGTLSGFSDLSGSHAIISRDGGAVVLGWSDNIAARSFHSFLWHDQATGTIPDARGTALVELPPLPGCRNSWAWRTNSRLEIVGWSEISTDGYSISSYVATVWHNGRATDLNTLINDTRWHLEVASSINENGLIVGHGTLSGIGHAFLLVPVEIMVDANRDGDMSFADTTIRNADRTTPDKPYRFWLNNDHDIHHTVDGTDDEWDDASDGVQDCDYTSIYTTRDLEDFTRLRISFAGITGLLADPQLSFYLEWRATDGTERFPLTDGSPDINVYQERDAGIRPGYLEDQLVASRQRDTPYDMWIGGVKAGQAMDLFSLRPSLRSSLSEDAPILNLLFCGKVAGRGQLILTIKMGNIEVGRFPPVYVELLDVKDMYERWTVGDGNGGDPEVLPLPSVRNLGVGHLRTGHSRPFGYSDSDSEEQKYILFVHGWNLTPEQKDQFAETAFKRLFWQGYKGRFGAFQWPTTFNFGAYLKDSTVFKTWVNGAIAAVTDPTNYDRGEWSAWRSGVGLERLLLRLHADYPSSVYMFAHSMGNVVAGEALRLAAQEDRGILVNTYVASQAAVPAHCYEGTRAEDLVAIAPTTGIQLPPGGTLYPETPNVYKNWFAANAGAVSRTVNFYNVNDYALWNDCWQLNQYLKPDQQDLPDQRYTYSYADSDYTVIQDSFKKSLIATGEVVNLHIGTRIDLQDRYEIMSFSAEARSKAVGNEGDISAFEGRSVDLQRIWAVDAPDNGPRGSSGQLYGAHKWHSAEFRSTNMLQQGYWKALLDDKGFGIMPTQ